MSGPSESKPSLADYRAAVKRLECARETALVERGRVEVDGDIASGDRNISDLRAALNEFKEVRARLSPQDLFVIEFNVEVVKPRGVSLVLPRGMSFMNYFERAQELSRTVYDREAVYQGLLDTWKSKSVNTILCPNPFSTKVVVELCLEGSERMEVSEQDVALQRRHLQLPQGIHVMAAVVAYTIATGEQPTNNPDGPFVRVADGFVNSAGRLGVYFSTSLESDDGEAAQVGVAGCPILGSLKG